MLKLFYLKLALSKCTVFLLILQWFDEFLPFLKKKKNMHLNHVQFLQLSTFPHFLRLSYTNYGRNPYGTLISIFCAYNKINFPPVKLNRS